MCVEFRQLFSDAIQQTCDNLYCFVVRLSEQIAELEAAAAERAAERRNVGMASVNRRNTNRNFENAFKNVGARPEGARLADDGTDPFSRRKTRPMNYWSTKRKQAETNGANCACGLLPFHSRSDAHAAVWGGFLWLLFLIFWAWSVFLSAAGVLLARELLLLRKPPEVL